MFFGFAREIVGVQPTKKNSARRYASRTALPQGKPMKRIASCTALPLHRGVESRTNSVRRCLSPAVSAYALCTRAGADGYRIREKGAQTVSGCFSVSLAKSSVFSRRRKTPSEPQVRKHTVSVFFADRMTKTNHKMQTTARFRAVVLQSRQRHNAKNKTIPFVIRSVPYPPALR